jgi:hypothetical protein
VLDIAFESNLPAVLAALTAGARVCYFDHHFAGDVPSHAGLQTHIDTAADVCTSLLVDRFLTGSQRPWAIVAAYGDNLAQAAERAAAPFGYTPQALAQLRELGECINYNAYGETVDDLHYHPADLYRTLAPYTDPFQFISGEPVFEVLREGMTDDLYRAADAKAQGQSERHAVIVLPDAAWSRRVAGVLGNKLAREHKGRAHAVLTAKPGGFLVSVRAPVDDPRGADALCRQFETGGGRAGAAGINHLPHSEFDRFVRAFVAAYGA